MRHRFFGSSKFSTTGMHPSPFSTSMRSHSLTGASARTADRSFMYPLTGRSSCPLIAATSTSVMLTTPISRPKLEAKTHFFNFYDELFVNLGSDLDWFDQNRFYLAYGYLFGPNNNLQVGVLWQAFSSVDFYRLQFFYTHNFDLRD